MSGYDYNYRSRYSTGRGVGTYTDQWGQTRQRTPQEVEARGYGYASGDKYGRPLSPPRQVVDDVTTIVHTETIREQPARVGAYNSANWRQPPNQTGYDGTTGYDGFTGYNSNTTLYNPNENIVRSDNYDDYYNRRKGTAVGPTNLLSHGGNHRAKPSRSSSQLGAVLPVRGDGRLSIPTDDLEKALHYLKECANGKIVR